MKERKVVPALELHARREARRRTRETPDAYARMIQRHFAKRRPPPVSSTGEPPEAA